MTSAVAGVRRALIDGLLVVGPLGAAVLLLVAIIKRMRVATDPLTGHYFAHPVLAALVLFVLLCLIVGVLVHTAPGHWSQRQLERVLFERIPAYQLLRAVVSDAVPGAGSDRDDHLSPHPALAQLNGGQCPCLVMDRFADGRLLVFVPASPAKMSGTLYVFTPERVQLLDVPLLSFVRSFAAWGFGMRDLIEAGERREPRIHVGSVTPLPQGAEQGRER